MQELEDPFKGEGKQVNIITSFGALSQFSQGFKANSPPKPQQMRFLQSKKARQKGLEANTHPFYSKLCQQWWDEWCCTAYNKSDFKTFACVTIWLPIFFKSIRKIKNVEPHSSSRANKNEHHLSSLGCHLIPAIERFCNRYSAFP